MWLDVAELQAFYNKPLGNMASHIIGQHIREAWPDLRGMNLLGLGFSTPYLDLFRHETRHIFAAIPDSKNVLHWPKEGPGRTVVTHENCLPLPDLSIDRIILIHYVENSEAIRTMFREIWRVLSSSGRLIVIVPNRRGVWARTEQTPFGYGRPYSQSQLTQLLNDTLFTPLRKRAALYVPPSNSRMIISSAAIWEKIGQHWLSILGRSMGGVISIEASKQIYAVTPKLTASRRRSYVTVPNQ